MSMLGTYASWNQKKDLPPFVDGNVGTKIYGKDYLELNWGK